MDSQGLGTQNLLEGAVKLIQDRIPASLQRPRVAIVCGSGLSTLGETIRGRVDLPYTSIPGFTSSTGVYRASSRAEPNLTLVVAGHGNALVFGYLGTVVDVPVVVMLGRVRSSLLACSVSLVDAQSANRQVSCV